MTRKLAAAVLFGLLAMTLQASSACADDEIVQRAQNIVDGWKTWVRKHDISEAAIAISHKGVVIAQFGIGRDADTPAPVASVSKAITGICVAKLAETGAFSFDSALKDIVPELESDVTVTELMLHTSGYTRDITQRPDKYIGRNKEYQEWVGRKEIEKGRDSSKIGEFHYNNSNYAMLGAIIRKVTGNSYEDACKDLVFRPIGVEKVDLNPDWRIHGAFGGWRISALDHLKFLNAYFGNDKVYNRSPVDWPRYSFGNGLNYGMGYMFRKGRAGGYNFWHDGRWHTDIDGKAHRFGAFFVSYDNGWKITTNHSFSAIDGEHGELDRIFAIATHQPL
ncbi:MAG: serine hydrolase domain-containing protein [Nitratireductor sp.]